MTLSLTQAVSSITEQNSANYMKGKFAQYFQYHDAICLAGRMT
jgi:hypothetical protein